ncbi:protein kinase/lanthionine synthetase C family protein [Streptacidiphilus sp. PB12-B1b]|uniref:class IV lanthionine synthetase LanL n=1 Tax=Streptacidiphilus sp. PB12-B1b TaxID=2705012 RepID=UPI0015FAB354|nr:class IV lanthionine synthetase LanL [Streptacidiphilus sp. PB12-B1b]QMU78058.1 protein kinase/lanthionine synthetase C family protein [Streptacidiphilus sp. PB12-B1b]
MTGTDSAVAPRGPERDADLLPGIVRSVLAARGADDWTLTPGPFWCRAEPARRSPLPDQGWKLHVSATPLAAPLVLHRCAEVLLAERATFKFAGTLGRAAELVSARYDRGGGGKFLTAYPDDDEQFRRLAEALHRATSGLPNPGILSDRPYRPGSSVHYRYGGFKAVLRLGNDGSWEPMLTAPDGQLQKDQRLPWYSPPAWARPPLPEDAAPADTDTTRPAAVLLNDRYVVRRAIRHAYKGGVFLGTDRQTGREVVVKEARRHVGAQLSGQDAAAMLRHEAAMHAVLAPLGLAPEALDQFTQGGNHYLVQERVDGETLRAWVAGRSEPALGPVLHLARQLVAAVAAVHRAGYVLRDLNPNNLMVTTDGRLRLIDLEMVARPGDHVRPAYTPGYGAPEVVASPLDGPAPGHRADLFSLGATLVHLACGTELVLVPDQPNAGGDGERRRELVTRILQGHPGLSPLLPVALGLLAEEPGQRWSLGRAEEFLAGLAGGAAPSAAAPPGSPARPSGTPPHHPDVLPEHTEDRMLADGLGHLLATRTPDDPDHLWPAEGFAARVDALSVQHGAAGVLAVLTAAAAVRDDDRLRAAVADSAEWIVTRLGRRERTLPGLYFGRSGTAWTLLDAARLLADDRLEQHALDLARQVPLRWPNPDVCHGLAGAGLAQLHIWRTTGEPDFRDRAVDAAEQVLTAARPGRSGVNWPIPDDFDSALAGANHLGFGHGVAGVGTFLLLAGAATDRADFVDQARRAGDTLVTAARSDGTSAWWPVGDTDTAKAAPLPHWCSGASGIGTFLIRLWQATGEPRYRELAEQAAAEVHRRRWQAAPVACHGLAGNADFLLDLAAALDEPRYRHWARELVACAHARRVHRDGLLVLPDETLGAVRADYNTGMAGMLGLLLRLRHGGPRMWLPDSLALPAPGLPRQPELADAGAGSGRAPW